MRRHHVPESATRIASCSDNCDETEENDEFFADPDNRDVREVMADIYGVNPEWLAGDVPRHDYARADAMRGADKLTSHDRDVIAEFAASMPRDTRTAAERIAAIARRKAGQS